MCSKKCAKPVRPGRSFFEPDVIPHLEVHDRRRMIFEKDHVEPVGQRRHRVVEPRRTDGRVRRRRSAPSTTARTAATPAPRTGMNNACEIDYDMPPAPGPAGPAPLEPLFELVEPVLELADEPSSAPAGAGRPPTPSASRGCRSRDSRTRTRRRRPNWECRSAPVATTPLPIVRWPATPTCPASVTRSSIDRAAGDADLRGEQHVPADRHAVRDLHEVVDLGAGADARLADGGAIDRRVRADLDVVLDRRRRRSAGSCGACRRALREAEAVAADDGAVLDDDAVADLHALADRDARVDHAVLADDGARRRS